jgi:ABC-type transport system substrate-binding protein
MHYTRSTRMASCLLFFIVISFGSLLGCSSQGEKESGKDVAKVEEPSASPQSGGVYRAPLSNSPTTLDPAYVQNRYGTAVIRQLFDGLVRFGPHLMILPALAESWEVEDGGTTYRFHLRQDAIFHNNEAVTAQDAAFSLKRLLRVDPAPGPLSHLLKIVGARAYKAGEVEDVEGIEVVDERTLLIKLEDPYTPFLTALGMQQTKIVPQKVVEALGPEFGRNPVGSGPFRFTGWEENKAIRLVRFPEYFAEPAYLDEVVYVLYPGGTIDKMLVDFMAGELEEVPVFGSIRDALAGKKDLQRFHRPSLSLFYYGMRVDHPLLSRSEWRQALSSAVEREKIVQEIYSGRFQTTQTLLPPGMPGYQPPRAGEYTLDADALARMTKEAEADGVSLSLEIVSAIKSPISEAELEMVQKAWAKLGITTKIKYITDWKQFEEYIASDAVQLYRYAWFAEMPDPDSMLAPLFESGATANYGKFQDEETDRMLAAARSVTDPVERSQAYREVEEHILKFTPIVPLFYLSVDSVYQPYVKNVSVRALGPQHMALDRVWLEKKTLKAD